MGQLLGIEPSSVESQSTILPINYSCRKPRKPHSFRARYRTRTDTSKRVAFKATVSTISPSGRIQILSIVYPEADLNCQNTDTKSVTSTIPSSRQKFKCSSNPKVYPLPDLNQQNAGFESAVSTIPPRGLIRTTICQKAHGCARGP